MELSQAATRFCPMPRRSVQKTPLILIVEDEPLVRELEADILLGGGFRLLEAATADEAFEILRGGRTFSSSSRTSICRARSMASSSHGSCSRAGRRSPSWSRQER